MRGRVSIERRRTKAVLLHQRYGFYMWRETVSFHERNGFSLSSYTEEQRKLFLEVFGDDRAAVD